MSLSIAHISAGDIMKFSAALLNDPEMTDYTYVTMLPYLNMAINELNENIEEANIPAGNQTSIMYTVLIGTNQIYNPPTDIVEVQELAERDARSGGSYIPLPRREFPDEYPITKSLMYWCWKNQRIYFNLKGANTDKEVVLKYISRPIVSVRDEFGMIGNSNAASFLIYKTAALLSMFVGENETRASALNEQAELGMERVIGISNKGRQQIMTRHRPFRASYKMRGY